LRTGRVQPVTCMLMLCIVALCGAQAGCQSTPKNTSAVYAYYAYDFPAAREALRGNAMTLNDEQVVLNTVRLGVAALADGDADEAGLALELTFQWLSTAGLNADRTAAAVWFNDGVRIWKGEPFEQALAYYWVAAHFATLGDWENTRAAAANALFRLRDFGADQDDESLARKASEDEDYLDTGYTAVDTNFALGFLMQAVGSDLAGAAGRDDQFDTALDINPALEPIVTTLRTRDYDTLLLIDYGKGPTKIAYGPDGALAGFRPQDTGDRPVTITLDEQETVTFPAVCNVNALSVDHRWNNLEDVRKARSAIGHLLQTGGAITLVTASGSSDSANTQRLVGLGLIIAGAISRSNALADTRYMEFAPQLVYVAPLKLDITSDVQVQVGDQSVKLNDVQPGTPGNPRAIYVRLHGPDSPQPPWLHADDVMYSNDVTGVMPGPEGYPYILGGRDVSAPSRSALLAYQANGYLLDYTVLDLVALYDAEGLHIGSGMENAPDTPRNPSFRHVLEGGTGVFTPQAHTMGYKRIMGAAHPPYRPKSQLVRNAAAQIRVLQEEPTGETP
jgi:hypothetical protein